MKKMLALTLALVMALGLCACGGDTTDPAPEENPAAETVEIPPVEDLTSVDTSAIPGVEDGVLTVGMSVPMPLITGPRWMTATVRYPSPMYLVLMPMAMM